MKKFLLVITFLLVGAGRAFAGWVSGPPATAAINASVTVSADGQANGGFSVTYLVIWAQSPPGTWTPVAVGTGVNGATITCSGSKTLDASGTWNWDLRLATSGPSGAPTGTQLATALTSVGPTPTTFSFGNLSHTYNGSTKTATVTPSPGNATYSHDLTKGPGAGSYSVSATANGDFSGSNSATLVIDPAPASFSLNATSFTYNGGTQGPSIVPSPSGVAYTSGGTLAAINAGNYTATASAYGDYTGANNSLNWTITPAGQTITFSNPGTQAYGTPLTLGATASSSLAVAYAIISGSASVAGNVVTFTAPGSVTVRASQPGNANFTAAAVVDQTFTVSKANQTITFNNPGPQTYGTPLTLGATASSSLTVAYAIISGPASVAGSVVTFTAPGSVTVRASQAGNTNYNAAPNVDQSFTVNKATPTGTFASRTLSAPVPAGYTVVAGDLNATFTGPGGATAPTGAATYLIVGPGTAVTAGTLLAPAAYTIRASYPGDANYTALNVDATWTITNDTDGDGVPNYIETQLGTNPNVAKQNDATNQTQLKISKPN